MTEDERKNAAMAAGLCDLAETFLTKAAEAMEDAADYLSCSDEEFAPLTHEISSVAVELNDHALDAEDNAKAIRQAYGSPRGGEE